MEPANQEARVEVTLTMIVTDADGTRREIVVPAQVVERE